MSQNLSQWQKLPLQPQQLYYPQQQYFTPPPISPLQPPRRRRYIWLWILGNVIALIIIGIFASWGGSQSSSTSATNSLTSSASTTTTSSPTDSVPTTTSSPSSNPYDNSQIAKVGQTITVDGVATTLIFRQDVGRR